MKKSCLLDDCPRYPQFLGLCKTHYEVKLQSEGSVCAVDGCDRGASSRKKTLCDKHSQAVRRNDRNPLKRSDSYHRLSNIDPDARTADCSMCGTKVKIALATGNGCGFLCYSTKNKRRLSQYGLDEQSYSELLRAQNNVCKVCGRVPDDNFVIDHDHRCCPGIASCGKCVRGLLCRTCNSALGLLKDDVNILRSAIEYIELYRESNKETL